MTHERQAPPVLKQTQEWFGSIISQRLPQDNHISLVAPSGKPIKEEAPIFIAPSPTLEPYKRIELYHQQYWWRLLNILHETFPLAVRLFGYGAFNETVAKPYLLTYPPNTWSLNPLGSRLAEWVEKYYKGDDKLLVLNAVKVDYMYIDSFVAAEYPPIKAEDEATLMEKALALQPHIQTIALPYDLFLFRKEMLSEPVEHWVDHPFPKLSKKQKFYFVVARSRSNDIGWSQVPLAEFLVLEQLKKPQTLMQLCEWLEKQKREIVKVASENLQSWFQSWTARRWLTEKA